jgi:pSer/pThr/pTyr-binding forkhead associated (FHA) protein
LSIGSTVIGRGDQANLRLPDVGISRRHARIDFDGGQVVLTDLGSTNGTSVNGQRVSAVALNPGDMVQLGTTTLTFRVDG